MLQSRGRAIAHSRVVACRPASLPFRPIRVATPQHRRIGPYVKLVTEKARYVAPGVARHVANEHEPMEKHFLRIAGILAQTAILLDSSSKAILCRNHKSHYHALLLWEGAFPDWPWRQLVVIERYHMLFLNGIRILVNELKDMVSPCSKLLRRCNRLVLRN